MSLKVWRIKRLFLVRANKYVTFKVKDIQQHQQLHCIFSEGSAFALGLLPFIIIPMMTFAAMISQLEWTCIVRSITVLLFANTSWVLEERFKLRRGKFIG